MPQLIGFIIIVALIAGLFSVFGTALLFVGAIYLIYEISWQIVEYFYYRSSKFLFVKQNIASNTQQCNDLNQHIEELKRAYVNINTVDYGQAEYKDDSYYNYKRPNIDKLQDSNNIYECSLSVCKNAQAQPFKYFCKYFNIKTNEQSLEKFEKVFNDFSAAEQGKTLLKQERDSIINSLNGQIPFLIIQLRKDKLMKKLGFDKIDFAKPYFPKYTFRYISPAGNSSMVCDILFDLNNLERFINYLSEVVKFRQSIAGQRALMTSSLREKIKNRDNYTCQICGLSTSDEPHLLLEIDHIIPLSKGGITSENNLQTLCWKCNRSKSNKLVEINQKEECDIKESENRVTSKETIENFRKCLETKLVQAGLKIELLESLELSDKTVNFSYNDCQIGRIKLGKRKSKMQIITSNSVEWIEDKNFDEYIDNIDKWVLYAQNFK